ncbi:MAG: SUMF1/EgtB/PvdO family nonheme iron enzyme [Polyangia bacterium]
MAGTENEWSPPQSFDEYRLVSLLGRGGMGEVYLGRDTLLDRAVAIKFIRTPQPDHELRELLLLEARAAARLQHPNVTTIYRVGEIDGHPYIISEFIRGRSLDRIPKPLPWQRALKIGIGLCRALAAAHRRGVLHRDIKPANAIISESDEIKLLDFGLAKFVDVAARPEELIREGPVVVGGDYQEQPLDTQQVLAETQAAVSPDGIAPGASGSAVPRVINEEPTARSPLADRETPNKPPGGSTQQLIGVRTQVGVIKGTPLYMAPELWRGELASRRSDVYSMGALLYELCAGEPPHADATLAELPKLTSKDAPPLLTVAPKVDPRLAAIIDRCMRTDPSQRYSSGEELRAALEELEESNRSATVVEGNPYRGLLAFEAKHRAFFFGRDNEIGTVLERLRSESFVLVAADSGLGKSSLCRAGVLPRVEEGALGADRRWMTVTILPGRHPVTALAAALGPMLGETPGALGERILQQPSALAGLIEHALGADRGLVIFIDQMEELISLSDSREASALATALGGLTDRLRSVRLLATARSDFLARLATLPVLGDDLSRVLYLLRPLSRDRLRDVIVGPARKKGVRFESDGLVETLIDSTVRTEGGLPLLQFALAELWDAHKDSAITAMALADIGGVTGALARHADHVYLSLPEDQQVAARRILMDLVTLEGTRARRREAELVGTPQARLALEALLRGRLLIARDVNGTLVYEVAHEALIKGWGTLRHWIDEQHETRAIRQSLERAALDWQRLGGTREALWGQRQLAEISSLDVAQLSDREAEFIKLSRRKVLWSTSLRSSLIIILPLLFLVPYLYLQARARRELDRRVGAIADQGQQALQKGQHAAGTALTLRQAALLAFDSQNREAGEKLWNEMRGAETEANQLFSQASQVLESGLALDPQRTGLRDLLGLVLLERALQAERDGVPWRRDDLLQRMTVYDPSGKLVARFSEPGHLRLRSQPPGARVTLARYAEAGGRRELQPPRPLGETPIAEVELPQGSYLLTLRADGRHEVLYPLLVGRGEKLELEVSLPPAGSVPPGYVYIPAGRFLFGTATDDTLRQSFLSTVPLHPRETGAYLISRYETTYRDWISYLSTLPRPERVRRKLAVVRNIVAGGLNLVRHNGIWELTLQVANQTLTVHEGERITYPGRKENASQDWLRMPVSGITYQEAREYAAWLDQSGQLPGARLCTEIEWERAARGADDREFPTGNQLVPGDANFDLTYGKAVDQMGPDEVGSHPRSRSPFGVEDLTGNVFEWTDSSLSVKEAVARGGAYSYASFTCRSTNRTVLDAGLRDPGLGLRICATWKPPAP